MIKRTDRTAIFGKNGSGKSELARRLWIGFRPPRIVIDVKADLDLALPGVPSVTDPRAVFDYPTVRAVPPGFDEDWYNALYATAFERGDVVIWMDEFNEITKPSSIPDDVRRYINQGRSRGCGHIGVTQRPADVHPSLATQAQHIFVFWLSADLDRRAAARMAGMRNVDELEDLLEDLEDHGHIYVPAAQAKAAPVLCDPLPHPDELTARIRTLRFGP